MKQQQLTHARLQIWPEEHCLLSELCQQLHHAHPDTLDQVSVVLPTERLATMLTAMLAKERGAFFVPPRFFTLDRFIEHCAAQLASRDSDEQPSPRPLSAGAAEVLLGALLQERSYRHFHAGHERELLRLFAEIAEYGLGSQVFARLAELAQHESQRSMARSQRWEERFYELEQIFTTYMGCIEQQRCSLGQALRLRQASAVSASLRQCALHELPWQQLYIACFTSVKSYYYPLLETLGQKATVSFYLSVPPPLLGTVNPLGQLIAALGIAPLPAPRRQRAPQHELSQKCAPRLRCFSSRMEELAFVCSEVERLVAEGCPPAEIAMVVSNEIHYGSMLRAFIAASGLSCNIALAASLAESTRGRWLGALLGWLREADNLAALLSWCEQPHTRAYCGVERAALRRLLFPLISSGRSLRYFTSCSRESVEEFPPWLQQLLQLTEDLRRPHAGELYPLEWWITQLQRLVHPFVPAEEFSQLWEDMRTAAALRPCMLRKGAFFALLQKALARGSVRSIGFPLQGVQVIGLSESRYVPFRHVFVLGCLEGNFPRALPADRVLENHLREKIGLPGWSYIEALEDTTFQLLRQRCRELTLTYPAFVDGAATVRSRFIEQLVRHGCDKEPEISPHNFCASFFAQKAEEAWQRPALSAQAARGAYQGERREFFAATSATQLEKLLSCPYQFLLSSLGVEELRLEDGSFSSREEGEALHRVLEAFFSGMLHGRRLLSALSPEEIADGDPEVLLGRFKQLSEAVLPASQRDSALFYHLLHYSWPRVLAELRRLYASSSGASTSRSYSELRLGAAPFAVLPEITLQLAAQEFLVKIRGTIDRLDMGEDFYRITDYKRRTLPSHAELMRGDAPQLLLYAMALAELPPPWGASFALARATLVYWSLLQGKAGGTLAKLESACGRMKERWQQRVQALLIEERAFAPEPGRHCEFCAYAGICRKDEN